jgi:hypothetical protein
MYIFYFVEPHHQLKSVQWEAMQHWQNVKLPTLVIITSCIMIPQSTYFKLWIKVFVIHICMWTVYISWIKSNRLSANKRAVERNPEH